jgi:ABC-2 type transport system ATP-binding protein
VISASHTDRQSTFLVRTEAPIHDPHWTVSELSLEDLVLAYMGHIGGDRGTGPPGQAGHRPTLEVLQ